MRRVSLAWVLSLLLVFAQLGAVLHELGHLSQGAGNGAQLSSLHDADRGACPSCEGFAQVANPAGGALVALAAPLPAPAAVFGPGHAFAGADAPTPRNRGPPHV